MMAPSMNMECDSCAACGMPRPGFIDPAVKAAQWKASADAAETQALQGLPGGQQETRPLSGTQVRKSQPHGEEAA
jgi:hypothetical protein